MEPIYMSYLQESYNWTNQSIKSIAWESLNLRLKRIDREVIPIKIYNDQLPTAITLQKWKWYYYVYQQQKTRDHMIQCPNKSQIEWRIKTLAALRKQMKQFETKIKLGETMCFYLSEWFKIGHIQ